MIERFEVGKKYRFVEGPEPLYGWTPFMQYLKDGNPHTCTIASGMYASFSDDLDPFCAWCFDGDESHFEEVI